MATIALEEHFWTPRLAAPPGTGLRARPDGAWLDAALTDLDDARIADMDAAGIDLQVLSHVQPAAQGPGKGDELVEAARQANDHLAAAIARHPGRLAGFATLPTDSPGAAADELARCAAGLGFVGGMVHSTLGTDGFFLDDPRYAPLLSRFESLDVPLYLHPAQPPAVVRETLYGGLPAPVAGALATNAWGWHAEAGLHALRLVASGVLERHPGLKLIIGHGGEMIPFMLDRVDDMLPPKVTGLAEPPSAYFQRHFWVTTSGMFSHPPVMCALAVFGPDRVLFSVDYPFGANQRGRQLLDTLPVSEPDRAKIAGQNAQALLRLSV
jgi:predicted TIM-barrel fold metal-dependent hydrolase